MILGCGVDLMEVARFEHEVAQRGRDLLEELFTPAELAWCDSRPRPAEAYAAGYAAKEACFKALGTGKVGRMTWRDIEIGRDGAVPTVSLRGESAVAAARLGAGAAHLALTATRTRAVAWVLLE